MDANTQDTAVKEAAGGQLVSKIGMAQAKADAKHPLGAWWARIKKLYDPEDIILFGSYFVHLVTFWGINLTLLAAEAFLPWLIRLKTQHTKRITRGELFKMVKQLVRNHLLLLVPAFLVSLLCKRVKAFRDRVRPIFQETVDRPLPSMKRVACETVVSLGVDEVIFYASHRLLHTRRFYLDYHKLHHTFKYPIGLASEYATFTEYVISNILPGAVGPALLQSHPLSAWAWIWTGITLTSFHHSGYLFPFYPFNDMTLQHDYHHHAFYHNFGITGIIDRLCGTDGGQDYIDWKGAILRRVYGAAKGAGRIAQ